MDFSIIKNDEIKVLKFRIQNYEDMETIQDRNK